MRIKCSESIKWSYFCNSFCIFLNAIFYVLTTILWQKIIALFHCHLFEYPTIKQAYVSTITKPPSVLYLHLFYYFFNRNLNNVILSMDFYVWKFSSQWAIYMYMRHLILGFPPSYRPIRLIQCSTSLCFTYRLTQVCEQSFSWLSKYAEMTRKMNRGHFIFFVIYVQHLHNLREEEKLWNSGYMA